MIKTLNKLAIEGNHINIIKMIYEHVILNGERQSFSSKIRKNQRCPLLPLLLVLEARSRAVKK